MNQTDKIQTRAVNFLAFIKSYGITLIVCLAISIVCVIGVQRACDNRSERIENEKIAAYEAELAEKLKVFQNYIDLANRDHETTTAILDGMSAMSKNINDLAANDRAIAARVDGIESGDYKQARTQKNDQAAIRRGSVAATRKPISRREIDALKVDEELYPN